MRQIIGSYDLFAGEMIATRGGKEVEWRRSRKRFSRIGQFLVAESLKIAIIGIFQAG